MNSRNDEEELANALVGFVLVAVLFVLGCVWNTLTNNI